MNELSRFSEQNNRGSGEETAWGLPEGAIARLGRGRIADLAFSPDGESLAITTTIGVWIYELATMEPIALWETERGLVSTVAFSPNGQWIATINWDGVIKIREIETQRCTAKIQVSRYRNALAFSSDSQYLAASGSGYGGAYVWDAKTGRHVTSFEGAAPPKKGEQAPARFLVCFSPDEQCLAYVLDRVTLAVRHIETKEHIARLKHISRIRRIQGFAFSPCGRFLAVSSQNTSSKRRSTTELQVWNIDEETLEMTDSDYGGDKLIPAYSSDGTLRVADLHKDKVDLWDASRREQLDTFEYSGNARNPCRFSSDGQQFAIAAECEMRVWRADAPLTVVSHLKHAKGKVQTLFFMQGGKTLVSGDKNGIMFWDVVQRRVRRTLSSAAGRCVLSPCENMLAINVGENGETIEVLRSASGILVTTFTEHKQEVTAFAFSPTGEHLVSGDLEGNLCVWSVESWRELRKFIGHTTWITTLAFHPSGAKVVTAAHDYTVRVWDVESGEQLALLPLPFLAEEPDASLYRGDQRQIRRILNRLSQGYTHRSSLHSIAFSPSGDLIAGGLHREICLWNATTYETHMVIVPPDTCQRPMALIFSPCGRYLVSGSWWQDGQEKVSIRLWEVSTGENIATFWSHPTDIQELAFSPGGTLLASGGFDGTILLWDMKQVMDT